MPRPIEALPPPGVLASWVVGQQASGALFEGIAEALAFLCGRNLPQILSSTDLYPLDTQDVYVLYQRTPACRALAIAVELQGDDTGGRSTVAITLDTGSGSIAWYPTLGTSESNGQLDGTSELPATSTVQRDYPIFEGILDVSALEVGAVSVLRFSSGNVSSSGGQGIFSLSIWEVPIAACDPVASPSEEIGIDPAWLVGGNAIVDGSTASPRGIGRILREMDRARGEVPRQWQICTPEGQPWTKAATTTGALDWGPRFTSLDHVFRIRARKLYPGQGNRVRFYARYAWNGAAGSSYLRCIASTANLGGATTTNADILLENSGGASTFIVDSVAFELPLDGDDQEVELSFEADPGASVGLDVTNLVWIEDETDVPAALFEAVFWWEADDVVLSSGWVSQWNDKTGNARHAVLGSATGAVVSNAFNGRPAAQFYVGSLKNYYTLAHESALEPDSWTLFVVCSFVNSTLDWTLLKSSVHTYDGQTDGWGFREIFSGADYSFLTAYDSTCDTDTPGGRTVGVGSSFYIEPTEFGAPGAYLIVYDADAETLTITDSTGNTTQLTGIAPPRAASTADVWFGGSSDGTALGYDGEAALVAFWGRTPTTDEKAALFQYARSEYGAL